MKVLPQVMGSVVELPLGDFMAEVGRRKLRTVGRGDTVSLRA